MGGKAFGGGRGFSCVGSHRDKEGDWCAGASRPWDPARSPLFPAGAGGGEGGATGVRTEGRGPARAPPPPPRRRLGAGPPSPPPLPTLRPVAPGARAHTHASPGSMQMSRLQYPDSSSPLLNGQPQLRPVAFNFVWGGRKTSGLTSSCSPGPPRSATRGSHHLQSDSQVLPPSKAGPPPQISAGSPVGSTSGRRWQQRSSVDR